MDPIKIRAGRATYEETEDGRFAVAQNGETIGIYNNPVFAKNVFIELIAGGIDRAVSKRLTERGINKYTGERE